MYKKIHQTSPYFSEWSQTLTCEEELNGNLSNDKPTNFRVETLRERDDAV